MKFGGAPAIYDLNPYEESTVQQHPLGALALTADGRKFRYCKPVATTVTGDCYSSAGQSSTFETMAVNAIEPIGETKIAVIKALREINQELGLKEAKDATENLPFEVLKDAKPEDVKSASEKLKAAGATVELK